MAIRTWSGHSPQLRNRIRYGARTYRQQPVELCDWIAQANTFGIEHGWRPEFAVTSGYRPGTDPHTASGRSNHSATDYNNGQTPCGAEDFGGYTNPAGKRTKLKLIAILHKFKAKGVYKGPLLVAPIGFDDDGHCSGNGH